MISETILLCILLRVSVKNEQDAKQLEVCHQAVGVLLKEQHLGFDSNPVITE